ncbi:Testicular haploid expressed gene [Carabus blaptoides fortunei]
MPLKVRSKYEPDEVPSTIINRAVLEATCTPRLNHLSRPLVRLLEAVKNDKRYLGKVFVDTMNERIAMSMDTIYNHTAKSLRNIAADRRLSTKSLQAKKAKKWTEHGDKERMETLSRPRKPPSPVPPRRRKRKKLEQLLPNINKMAAPRYIYKRPSQDSMIKKLTISPDALHYSPTERILELTKLPPWRLVKQYVYTGKVPRGALLYKISENVEKLAIPKKKAKEKESDEKENPYDISPNALKYKPTPRIIILAKPVER